MKKILLILLITIPILVSAQTQPPNGTYNGRLYEYKYALRVDTVFLLPRSDTVGISSSLLAPGAMIYKTSDRSFYGFNGTEWTRFSSGTLRALDSLRYDPSTGDFIARYTTGGELTVPTGLVDSLKARWDTLQFPGKVQYVTMDKLLAEAAVPIQPGDSIVVGMGKLQAQINAQDGLNIKNQNSTDQPANFRILGTGAIRSTSAAGALTLRRGASMNYYPIVNFKTTSGIDMGYIGPGSNVDSLRVDVGALWGGVRLISSDTSSIRFGNYSPASNSRVSTGYHNLKWLMMPAFPVENDRFFDTSALYIKTLNVYGGIKSDTLDINGIYLGGGSAGQYLTLDATGKLVTPITLPSFAPSSGSTNYIQNQSASAQPSSSFWVSGSSRTNGVHSMGTTSRILGTNTGAANVGVLSFYENNGTVEKGQVGDVSSGNSDIALSSAAGDVVFVAGGSGKVRVGASTAALQVTGGVLLPTSTITGTTTLNAATNYTLRCNNSTNIVVNLPSAVGIAGQMFVIKKVSNNANTVTITANGAEQIDATASTKVLSTFNDFVRIQSNGTGWDIL